MKKGISISDHCNHLKLNIMQVNVKNEKPVNGTQEWAKQNVNFVSGCSHDCKYCYSKSMAVRFKRKTPENWKVEEAKPEKLNVIYRKKPGYTMFPSSHDISPESSELAMQLMEKLLDSGNEVLMVTKPHLSVIQDFCQKFADKKDQIMFRFTIGSINSETLKFWEPGAPSFEERLEALKFAFHAGFQTSVSSEPALDTKTLELVEAVLPYITDAVWIGLPNRLRGILKLNGADDPETMKRADELIAAQSDEWVLGIYETLKDNPKVKWKDSIKKIVGIDRPTEKGLDV